MPSKIDKVKLNSQILDRRVKLTDSDKEDVILRYHLGASITGLSKVYGVNKRLIQFILFPERKENNILLRKLRGGSNIYYDREKHSEAIKDLRRYKRELQKQGKI